jgi:hypothetical protein
MRTSLLLTFVAGACAGLPTTTHDYRQGLAHTSCGPADGPAILIVLSDAPPPVTPYPVPAEPFLELTLNHTVDRVVGQTVAIEPEGRGQQGTSFARQCQSSTRCRSASEGWVRIASYGTRDGLTRLTGDYRLQFSADSLSKGHFQARWLEHQPLCG